MTPFRHFQCSLKTPAVKFRKWYPAVFSSWTGSMTLTFYPPILHNDQTHSNNSTAISQRIVWVCLTILLALKGLKLSKLNPFCQKSLNEVIFIFKDINKNCFLISNFLISFDQTVDAIYDHIWRHRWFLCCSFQF